MTKAINDIRFTYLDGLLDEGLRFCLIFKATCNSLWNTTLVEPSDFQLGVKRFPNRWFDEVAISFSASGLCCDDEETVSDRVLNGVIDIGVGASDVVVVNVEHEENLSARTSSDYCPGRMKRNRL